MRSPVRSERSALDDLDEHEIELLRIRAARYAERDDGHMVNVAEAVVFTRRGTSYAAPLAALREVRPLRGYCRVPGTSPAVPGIMHLRGEILSLHDLAAFMDPSSSAPSGAWVVVVEHGQERIGLLADEITGIEQYSTSCVRPVPVTFGERGVCLGGILDGGALLLSPSRLFATPAFFSAF
jgi:purine-binding chemotaxis protein CheW